jgi:hypothetical protein
VRCSTQPHPLPDIAREGDIEKLDFGIRAAAEAGFPGFVPDACLINLYVPGAKPGLHALVGRRRLNVTFRRVWPAEMSPR